MDPAIPTKGSEEYHSNSCDEHETIEAVFVFHRHGDRTPGKPLVTDDLVEEESKFWRTKIPPPEYHQWLSEQFPIVKSGTEPDSNTDGAPSATRPFRECSKGNDTYGFLTFRGMHQLYHNGAAMARRYAPQNPTLSFRDTWDVRAVSTNYLRTAMSCQAFLDGLWNHHWSSNESKDAHHSGDTPSYDYPTHYEAIHPEDLSGERTNDGPHSVVEITIRDPDKETLNPFDSSPKLMKKLLGDAMSTPEFMRRDEQIRPLATRLTEYIPVLSQLSSYASSPSGGVRINWIHAADHFVCRASHSVPPTQFCPHLAHQDPAKAREEFDSLGRATRSHLIARFRSYYGNPALLAEMTGPALREVLAEMHQAIQNNTKRDETDKRPFRIYSCHDVTILALLHALKDRNLRAGTTDHDSLGSSWPTYGTCLTLELVRRAENKPCNDRGASFVVRAWINEAPIPNFSPLPVAIVPANGADPTHAIELDRFEGLVRELNATRVPKAARSRL